MFLVEPSAAFKDPDYKFQAFFDAGNRRRVSIAPYTGHDYSSLTGIFPGQGVQFEGRLSEWLDSQSRLKDHFQQADLFAQSKSWPRASMYLTSPERVELKLKPKVKNLALFALQTGLFEELSSKGMRFQRLTSYSFGEYAGWVAAGSLSFLQMLPVVALREELSPAPGELGVMILIGAPEEKIKSLLGKWTYYVGNRNTPEQVIISCSKTDGDEIVKVLFQKRVPCQRVSELPHPYHSPLMAAVAEKMKEAVEKLNLDMKPPRVPFYSSVLQRWVTAENFDKAEAVSTLWRQLLEPVDFPAQARALDQIPGQSVIELGPGTSCSDLLKKLSTLSKVEYLPLDGYLKKETVKRKEYGEKIRQSKFVGVVSKVVARITGYEIENIGIEDRFQEDLGIDSLKKAEVVFEVLETARIRAGGDLNTSRFQALGDLVEFLEVGPPPETGPKAAEIEWPFEPHAPEWMEQAPYTRLPVENEFREVSLELAALALGREDLITRVLKSVKEKSATPLLVTVNCGEENSDWTLSDWSRFALFLRDLAFGLAGAPLNVALIGRESSVRYQGARAFFQSLIRETPQIKFVPVSYRETAPSLAEVWWQHQQPRLTERLFSKGRWREKAWRARELETLKGDRRPLKMLWIGGAGGIGYELLVRCPWRADAEVHVCGRRPGTDIEVQDRVSMLEMECGSLTYHQTDASDPGQLKRLLDEVHRGSGGLDLIVNAAGVDRSALLASKTADEIEDELKQKLEPARHLESWLKDHPGVQRSHFSSISGLVGNDGQTIYSLANAALTAQVLNDSAGQAMIVHWPAWKNTGMTARSSIRISLAEKGVSLLKPEDGAKFFWAAVGAGAKGEWAEFTQADIFAYSAYNADYSKLTPFIGEIKNRRRRELEKIFRLDDDDYLLDHMVQGKACVPAASVLLMFNSLNHLVHGRFLPLKNFEMANMLLVDREGIRAKLRLEGDERGMRMALSSLAPYATSEYAEKAPALNFQTPFEPAGAGRKLRAESIYTGGVLFHGPRLQVLHEMWETGGGVLRARVEAKKLTPVYGQDYFDTLMPLTDGLFQMLGLSGYLERQLKLLPTGAEYFVYHPGTPWTDDFWLQFEVKSVSEAGLVGLGVIANSKGEPVIEIHGASGRAFGTADAGAIEYQD